MMLSCIKEEQTNYSAYLENPLQCRIDIQPFKGGFSNEADIITLSPGIVFKFAEGAERGKRNSGGFSSDMVSGTDSIVVVFDGLYKVVHLFNNTDSATGNYYNYASFRNLGNWESYIVRVTDETKHSITLEFVYTFTEEDFNYAKNPRLPRD